MNIYVCLLPTSKASEAFEHIAHVHPFALPSTIFTYRQATPPSQPSSACLLLRPTRPHSCHPSAPVPHHTHISHSSDSSYVLQRSRHFKRHTLPFTRPRYGNLVPPTDELDLHHRCLLHSIPSRPSASLKHLMGCQEGTLETGESPVFEQEDATSTFTSHTLSLKKCGSWL